MKILILGLLVLVFNAVSAKDLSVLSCVNEEKELKAVWIDDHGELIVWEFSGTDRLFADTVTKQVSSKTTPSLAVLDLVDVIDTSIRYGSIEINADDKAVLYVDIENDKYAINGTFICE